MAYKINEECTACDVCREECPNNAISEGDPIYVIDPNLCTECIGAHDEAQCVSVCPMDACVPDADHEETKEELMEKYKRLHPEG